MRAIWSGEIAFGLVTIPSKLYSATKDLTPQFHLIHKKCGSRVQLVRRCPTCRRDVAWDDIGKGYEVGEGKYALFSKKELAQFDDHDAKGTIEIAQFIELAEVDLGYIEKSYWVAPSGKSARSFELLRTALEKSEKVALAKVSIRTRPRLALLRPRDHLFSLDMMRFGDELIGADEVPTTSARAPTVKELKLADSLIEQLAGSFDPEIHPDEYRARVSAAVEEKIDRKQLAGSKSTKQLGAGDSRAGAKVIDLTELLARSLHKTKSTSAAPTRHRATSSASRKKPASKPAGRHHVTRRAAS